MLNLNIKNCSTEPLKDYTWEKQKLNSFRQRVLAEKAFKSRTNDEFLLSFLRGKKFDEDDALKCLKRYYDGKKRYPFIFKNLLSPAVKEFMDRNVCGYLESTDSKGRVIICGIANLQQIGWRHFLHFTPNFVYTAHKCMIGCYPISYKQTHLLVGKRFAYWFTTAVLALCPKKIRERVFLHTDGFESLHKEIERKYLPSDFKGELPPFDSTHCTKKLRAGEDYFNQCELHWTCDK